MMIHNFNVKENHHLVIDEATAPVAELIFSIAAEGVGLHTSKR